MKCFKKINSTNFNKRKDIVYDRFVLAQSYQRAAIILIDDVIKNNDENIYIESLNNKEEYYEVDKKAPPMIHNMQSLILPILFCTYQFIEQIIKGFVYLCTDEEYSHKTDKLYLEFKENFDDYPKILAAFDKYVGDSLHVSIKDFMDKNNLRNVSELYNSLRYSDRKSESSIDYLFIKHYNVFYSHYQPSSHTIKSKKSSIIFLEEIKNDLQIILSEARRMQLAIFDHFSCS